MVLCASEREGLWASGAGPRKVPGEGAGEVRVWPCVCGALEEWDRPALGARSWAGKGAQKEFDSERWRGSPGLPSPTLHGRPTMGVGLLGGWEGWPVQRGLEAARWGSGCACPHPALGCVEPSAVGAFQVTLVLAQLPYPVCWSRVAPWGLTPLGLTLGSSRDLLFSACCL